MRYRVWTAAVLMGFLAACRGDATAPVATGTLVLENQSAVGSNVSITQVYLRRCGSTTLGANRLTTPLGPSQSAQWELAVGCYDFSFVSTPGDEESSAFQVQIKEGETEELGVQIEVTTVTIPM